MPRSRRVWMNVFLGVVAAVCAFAIWSVIDLPWRARIFPQTVAGIGLIVTCVAWLVAWRAAGYSTCVPCGVFETPGELLKGSTHAFPID